MAPEKRTITQIIPAQGWYVKFESGMVCPLIAWATYHISARSSSERHIDSDDPEPQPVAGLYYSPEDGQVHFANQWALDEYIYSPNVVPESTDKTKRDH